jgi:transcriptional/translational regulatory protein YebC/TACO1
MYESIPPASVVRLSNPLIRGAVYGPDPNDNPQLATAIAQAKKASVPKVTIENAIARGQGRSVAGKSLQAFTFEIMMPPSVALIVDVETDNKNRATTVLGKILKWHNGRQASTRFLFSRIGRVVFEKHPAIGPDEILDDAIEAGAEDVEADEDGNVVVQTQPSQTMQVAQAIGTKFGLKILSADIEWAANEDTRAEVGHGKELQDLIDMTVKMREEPDVIAIWSNAAQGSADEALWQEFERNLDS